MWFSKRWDGAGGMPGGGDNYRGKLARCGNIRTRGRPSRRRRIIPTDYKSRATAGAPPEAVTSHRGRACRPNPSGDRTTARGSTWTTTRTKCLWTETIPARRRNRSRTAPCWTTKSMMPRMRKTGPASGRLRSGRDPFHGRPWRVDRAPAIHISHVETHAGGGEGADLRPRCSPNPLRYRILSRDRVIRIYDGPPGTRFSPQARCRTAAWAAAMRRSAKRSRRWSS